MIQAQDAPSRLDRRLPWLAWGPVHLGQHLGPKLLHRRCASGGESLDIFMDKYWQHLSRDSVAQPWLFAPAPSRQLVVIAGIEPRRATSCP